MRSFRLDVGVMVLAALLGGACDSGGEGEEEQPRFPGGTDPLPPLTDDVALPIVFVHGFAGSAAQYQSQQMRFVANGYSADRIYAYDHDGQGVDFPGYVAGTDEIVDRAMADHGVTQVYLVGHSRGTSVSSQYLGDAGRAAKIAKYISLDGSGCAAAMTAGVPCIEPNQAMLPGEAHVEVATSAPSFAMQYEFLIGEAPEVTEIVAQAAPVVIGGRAVNFPQNTGRDGATLDVWEIDTDTAARLSETPVATFVLGPSGDWGPVTVAPDKHYELSLSSDDSTTQQHFYPQPFLRSTNFVRLLSGEPDAPTRMNTNTGPDHAAVIAMRMREWKPSDVLEITTTSGSHGDQAMVDAITSDTGSDDGFASIAIHIHDDAATPGESSLDLLPYFPEQPFQTGVDVFMPAALPTDGTITARNLPRGDTTRPQVLRARNWPSSDHIITLMFSDFAQD